MVIVSSFQPVALTSVFIATDHLLHRNSCVASCICSLSLIWWSWAHVAACGAHVGGV